MMEFPEGWVVQQIPNFILHTDDFNQVIPTYVVVDSTRQNRPKVGSLIISRRKYEDNEREFYEPGPIEREFRRQWSLRPIYLYRPGQTRYVESSGPSKTVIKFSLLDLNNDILSETEFKVDRQREELENIITHIFQCEPFELLEHKNEIWCFCSKTPDFSTNAYIDVLPEGSTLITPPPDERWLILMQGFGFSEEE